MLTTQLRTFVPDAYPRFQAIPVNDAIMPWTTTTDTLHQDNVGPSIIQPFDPSIVHQIRPAVIVDGAPDNYCYANTMVICDVVSRSILEVSAGGILNGVGTGIGLGVANLWTNVPFLPNFAATVTCSVAVAGLVMTKLICINALDIDIDGCRRPMNADELRRASAVCTTDDRYPGGPLDLDPCNQGTQSLRYIVCGSPVLTALGCILIPNTNTGISALSSLASCCIMNRVQGLAAHFFGYGIEAHPTEAQPTRPVEIYEG